jgi:hypothetical protein
MFRGTRTPVPPQKKKLWLLLLLLLVVVVVVVVVFRPVLAGTRAQSCDWYGSGILGKFLGVVCLCFCFHVSNNTSTPSSERWNCGLEWCPVIFLKWCLFTPFRDLLHAANLQHGTDDLTSPPKVGMLRKNPTVSARFEPANLCTRGQLANH